MSLTIDGSTNTLTASSGLTVSGNTAVTGSITSTLGANFATSSGNVGIGTTTPGYQLHLSSTNPQIGLINTQGGSAYYMTVSPNLGFNIYEDGVGSRLTILSGNVGIGTTYPDKALEINSGSGANLRLTYNDSDGSAANYADFNMSSGGNLTIAPSGGSLAVTGSITSTVPAAGAFTTLSATSTSNNIFGGGTTSNEVVTITNGVSGGANGLAIQNNVNNISGITFPLYTASSTSWVYIRVDGRSGATGFIKSYINDAVVTTTTSTGLSVTGQTTTNSFAANLITNTAATYTVLTTDTTIIQTTAASTYTLPAAASFAGRILNLVTQFAGTVISASSNVVPLAGGAAGTAILAATAGKYATLQSNGTNWIIIAAN